MRLRLGTIHSRYILLSIFIILTFAVNTWVRAVAQTVTMTDTTIINTGSRGGVNLDEPSPGYPDLKNYYIANPGFEPVLVQQILQFQGTNSNSSPTSFQWNVNNTQYASYDANQWAGATFAVVQGSYASGTSDPALGCTGTIASSTNQSGAGPVFKINPSTNQGTNGCAGTLGLAGQGIIISTNNQMSNVFPTPSSLWAAGTNGMGFGVSLQGGATVASETNDLCATCGQQSLLFTIPGGGSVSLGGGPTLNSPSEKTVTLNGVYTFSFWAKSNAAVAPTVSVTISPRSGSNCTQAFSGSTSPAITSTWKQFSFNCSLAETPSATGYPLYTTISITPSNGSPTSLEFDNLSMVNTADTNPTPYTDAYVNALKAWCQSTTNATGPACTLRYGGHPDSETMANWVKPWYSHQPSFETATAISTTWATQRTTIYDFLSLCAYVGATPVLIFPSSFSQSDIASLMDYLEDNSGSTQYGAIRQSQGQTAAWVGSSGSPFSTIYLEFGNENWNGAFMGHSWGYNSSAPGAGVYYDYAIRSGVLFSTARSHQASQGYSQSATKFVANLQTAVQGWGVGTFLTSAPPDVFEFNGYTAGNISDTSTTGCLNSGATNATCPLYGATLTEPWSNTHDPKSASGFYQSLAAVQASKSCGPSANAQCEAMIYEENTGPGNAGASGPFTQAVSDMFAQAAFQGIVTADQLGENDAAGLVNQNYFTAQQYSVSNQGVNVHIWGMMIDSGGDCSMTNSSLFGGNYCPRPQMLGAQVYNWCKIGPMVQTSWTSNPTYNLPANNNNVNAINGVPVLRSFAFSQGNDRCMVVVNSDVQSSHNVTFAGTNAPSKNVTTYQYAPSSLNAANEMGAEQNTSLLQAPLFNTTTPGVDVTSGYTLPPHSVTAFMWQVGGGGGGAQTAGAPSFSPAGGTYSSSQVVAISTSTTGATIYYTTNGSTPTTSSAVYQGPMTVSTSETLKAIAVESGYTNSSVASAAFTINSALPAPTFSLAAGAYSGAQNVSIWDGNSSAIIYYTTNGTTPTTSSTPYSGPITVSVSETLQAIAVEPGYANSSVATAAYTINSTLPAPTFSVAAGTYSSAQSVSISEGNSPATIYYTTNGTPPTPSSTRYSGPITVATSETLEAIAVQPGYSNSSVALASYTINTSAGVNGNPVINFPNGFAGASGQIALNGSAQLSGSAVQLTSNNAQAASLWYSTPVSVSSFTTNFTFQLINAWADGMTFAIQNNSTSTIGSDGMNLGYGNIGKSVALKFDLYNNSGEGTDSTGLYTNGATPTLPATDMTSSGVELRSGDTMAVQVVYDGTTLTMTITDTVTKSTFTNSWTIDIPSIVGGNNAYVGFTGATGGLSANQEILSWTYSNMSLLPTPTFSVGAGTYSSAQSVAISESTSGATIHYTTDGSVPTTSSTMYTSPITVSSPQTLQAIAVRSGYINSSVASAKYEFATAATGQPVINFPGGFSSSSGKLALNGTAQLSGPAVQLTTRDWSAASMWYSAPVNIDSFTTNFTFQLSDALADGMTFAIQNQSASALGGAAGKLGYGNIGQSIAVKFDLYSNSGEGPDSTGLYSNGATPTVPATDLTPSGVNLHSGDTMAVQVVYNGNTLAMTITDTVTKATFTKSWTVNIPSEIGSNTAYVGFTGSTGGAGADQRILSWTYSN